MFQEDVVRRLPGAGVAASCLQVHQPIDPVPDDPIEIGLDAGARFDIGPPLQVNLRWIERLGSFGFEVGFRAGQDQDGDEGDGAQPSEGGRDPHTLRHRLQRDGVIFTLNQ